MLIYGDAGGALMVWDSKSGRVTPLAGSCGLSALKDGSALGEARIGTSILGIAVETAEDADGSFMILGVYFTESKHQVVRRLQWSPLSTGAQLLAVHATQLLSEENIARSYVGTLAGTVGEAGYQDSMPNGAQILFNTPADIWLDHYGSPTQHTRIYINDRGNGL